MLKRIKFSIHSLLWKPKLSCQDVFNTFDPDMHENETRTCGKICGRDYSGHDWRNAKGERDPCFKHAKWFWGWRQLGQVWKLHHCFSGENAQHCQDPHILQPNINLSVQGGKVHLRLWKLQISWKNITSLQPVCHHSTWDFSLKIWASRQPASTYTIIITWFPCLLRALHKIHWFRIFS